MISDLTTGLNRILKWIEKHEPRYVEYLQPGLSMVEIEEIVKELTFQLPPEVYELYQWRNGARQGDLSQDTAWLFQNWTFRSLQEVVAQHQKYLEEKCIAVISWNNHRSYLNNFQKLNIFYSNNMFSDFGCIWINTSSKFNPVIFESCKEGALTINAKYSSLTSMILTIAECYETSACQNISPESLFIACDPFLESKIWRKYNFTLIDFALDCLQEKSLSHLEWFYILDELVEFKDTRTVKCLIQCLQHLLDSHVDDITKYIGYRNAKLCRRDMNNNFDYYQLESGLPKILGEIGDIRAIPVLITALSSDKLYRSSYRSRLCAANALGQLKDNAATIPLIEALRDDSDEVRQTAAWALGEIGDPQAVEPLIEALSDSDNQVRDAAREALSKLITTLPEIEKDIPF